MNSASAMFNTVSFPSSRPTLIIAVEKRRDGAAFETTDGSQPRDKKRDRTDQKTIITHDG